ncbi:MAG: hypothetical protein EPN21_05130 [Methylococcaceae bacterium]|nr:MAG: hypothetical protein EPN21_05130 [Methylococcaceae bacterium]
MAEQTMDLEFDRKLKSVEIAGKTVFIGKIKVKNVPAAAQAVRAIYAGTTANPKRAELAGLLFERIESAIVLVARLLDVDEAWVAELSIDDLSVLLAEAWAVNENFFIQALAVIMQGWATPPASVGTTDASASSSEVTGDPNSPTTPTTISGDSSNPSPDPSGDVLDSGSI